MLEVETILNKYGEEITRNLKSDVSKISASGRTVNSIRYQVITKEEQSILRVFGREYFSTLESGRGPRKSSTEGGFKDNLEDYLRIKGFPRKTSKSGVNYYKIGEFWFTAKSLAWKINKEGDKTYRTGGRQVYSDSMNESVEKLTKEVTQQSAKYYLTTLKNVFTNS